MGRIEPGEHFLGDCTFFDEVYLSAVGAYGHSTVCRGGEGDQRPVSALSARCRLVDVGVAEGGAEQIFLLAGADIAQEAEAGVLLPG